MKWLKRIIFVTGIIVALEVAAWVGIALLGKDAFRTLLDFYDPRAEVAAVTSSTDADGSVQKCSTFGGELFCITDGPTPTSSGKSADAAINTVREQSREGVEKCAYFEGESICIKESI